MNAPVRLDKKLPVKKIAHSFTKRSNFDRCPRSYYEEYIAKNPSMAFTESEATDLGNVAHKYLQDKVALGEDENDVDPEKLHTELYKAMQDYNPDLIEGIRRALRFTAMQTGLRLVEQDWALTEKLIPTDWFGKQAIVFDRAKADFVCVNEPHALGLDYKTGSKYVHDDQLRDMAIHVFTRFPKVQHVSSRFLFLRELSHSSESGVEERIVEVSRDDVRPRVVHWFQHHKDILARNASGDWPMTPSKDACRFCNFADCENHPTGV